MRAMEFNADRSVPAVTGAAHARLKAATGDVHQRLEDRLDAVGQLSDLGRRADLVSRYAALHLTCDRAVRPWLTSLPELELGRRQRTPLLVSALAELGATLPQRVPDQPALGSAAEALGLLYVTEGATLGGRTILRSLAAQGVSLRGLLFLDPYGAETGAMWKKFRAILNQSLGDDYIRVSDAIRGAVRGFAFAELCLCESRVPE